MSPRFILLAVLACSAGLLADEKPSKVVKSVIKATVRAESYALEVHNEGGFARGADHDVRKNEISGDYSLTTVGKLTQFHAPVSAFRQLGRDGGALEQAGAWISLAREREGRLLDGLVTPLVEVLAEVLKLSRSASWDGEGRLRLDGSAKLAAAHFMRLQRSGYFEDEDQLANAPAAGSDEDFNWEVHEIVERVDKSRAQVIYWLQLDATGSTLVSVERCVVLAVRESSGESLERALGGAEHIAWRTSYQLSQLGEVEPPEVPQEALRWLR